MDNGNYLFVLYSQDFQPFTDGPLVTIPLTIGSAAESGNAVLYTVRSAKSDAVSVSGDNAQATVTVADASGIENLTADDKKKERIYSLSGRQLSTPQKGINIIGGCKIVVK